MNLQSPIFDKVRVPSRANLSGIIERVCQEYGCTADSVRKNRHTIASSEVMAVRRAILMAARTAGYAPSTIGQWFNHKDSRTVTLWLADMDELA